MNVADIINCVALCVPFILKYIMPFLGLLLIAFVPWCIKRLL